MKRFVSIWLMLTMLIIPWNGSKAFNEHEHNARLIALRFGEGHQSLSAEQQEKLNALTSAVYLALDQFNAHGDDKLQYLRETHGLSRLPVVLAEIDFRGNQHHRTFTHRGWDHVYPRDKANWPKRKETLLEATEKVFDFSLVSGTALGIDFGYDPKCESFAALLYYAHVLEDYEAQTTYKNNVMIPFAHPHADDNNPDLMYELIKHLEILFAEQEGSRVYTSMMDELKTIAEKARMIAGGIGGVNTDEKYSDYHELMDKCATTLNGHLHILLAKEDFWVKVFGKK